MKNFRFPFIVAVIMLILLAAPEISSAEGCFEGSGSESDPYRIASAADLARLAALVNAGDAAYANSYYIQTRDIDLSGYPCWTPIGTGSCGSGMVFGGTYDGNDMKITNLRVNVASASTAVYAGLFGCARGTIKNIKLLSGNISVSGASDIYAGGVAGWLHTGGTISDCTAEVDVVVSGSSLNNSVYAGGIAGYLFSENRAENCINKGDVHGASEYCVNAGGIAGRIGSGALIDLCSNYGEIGACGRRINAGGIAGNSSTVEEKTQTVSRCFNAGKINIDGTDANAKSGGIAGYCGRTNITDCFNVGTMTKEPDNANASYIGGIAGEIKGTSFKISHCYNAGSIAAVSNFGGIAGSALPGTTEDCYYDDVCPHGIGTGGAAACAKTSDELKRQSAYTGFDFTGVWTMDTADETGYDFAQLRENPLASGRHRVAVSVEGEACGTASGTGDYSFADTVAITAEPAPGYVFSHWRVLSGGAVLEDALKPATGFRMPFCDVSVAAVFAKMKYSVTVRSNGNGNVSGAGAYEWGDTVHLSAAADGGYQFIRWSVLSGGAEIADETDMTASFTMPRSDVLIEGCFGQIPPGFEYEIVGGEARITRYTGEGGDITIPVKLGGYGVASIGEKAFENNTAVRSVSFPETVRSIGDFAFYGCSKITAISIPDSVTDIGDHSFAGCSSAACLNLGAGVRNIGGWAFSQTGLAEADIPDNVVNIGENAFNGCAGLVSVNIGAGARSIGRGAFGNCARLGKITVSAGNDCFKCVDGVLYDKAGSELLCCPAALSGVFSIPRGVAGIYGSAFSHCALLTGVVMPDTVKEIGQDAFTGCTRLTGLEIPGSVDEIGSGAFYNCTALSEVSLPQSLNRIGDYVFYGCQNLSDILIPDSVTAIGQYAFWGCNELNGIAIPDSVVSIGRFAFSDCRNLLEVKLGKGLKYIGDYAFRNCARLGSVYYWGEKPVFSDSVFGGAPKFYYHVRYAYGWTPGEGTAFCMVTKVLGSDLTRVTEIAYFNEHGEAQVPEPVWYDHTFSGWFKDAELKTPWNNENVMDDFTVYAKWIPGPYTICAASDNKKLGEAAGGGSYEAGASVMLSAVPEDGCRFTGWYKNGELVSNDPVYTFNATQSASYTAKFDVIGKPAIESAAYIGNASLRITWTPVSGINGYEVLRSFTKDGPYAPAGNAGTASFTDTGLLANTTYYYVVRAYYCAGTKTSRGSESDYAAAKTAPAAPSIISAVSAGYRSINITWNPVSGADGYRVFRSTSKSGVYSYVSTTLSANFRDNGLKTGKVYYYKVCSYDGSVSSDFSEAAFCAPVPAAVCGLRSSVASPTSVRLSWEKPKGGSGYEIWRSRCSDTGYVKIGSARGTKYTDNGLIPGVTYYYKVRAYCKSGKTIVPGDFSEYTALKTFIPTVKNLKAVPGGATNVKLKWDKVSGKTGYEVWRSASADDGFSLVISTSKNGYTDVGLIPNTGYYYKVRAYKTIDGERYYAEYSGISKATPVLERVGGLKARRVSATGIKITWDPVPGKSGYEISRSTSRDGGYSVLACVNKTYYTDAGLIAGTGYYYKVRAYVLVNGIRIYSADSDAAFAIP